MDSAVDLPNEHGAAGARARRAVLVVNRKARNGAGPIEAAIDTLKSGGITLDTLSCDSPAQLREELKAAAADADCVIVGGGDGTLNCTAPVLRETGLPLGILPLGTANDLARTVGVSFDLAEAARVIVDGHLREIDLGEVNDHLYFNVASIGFSAEVAKELTADAKKRWGTLGYALAGLRLLIRTRPFTAFIEHDGVIEKVKTVQISVGSGRHYGGGLTVEEDAAPDDGKLRVYSLEVGHWSRLVMLAPALKRGTFRTEKDVRAFATEAVTIRTRRARSVNTDGELTTATPAVFRIHHKAVRVYAPAHSSS